MQKVCILYFLLCVFKIYDKRVISNKKQDTVIYKVDFHSLLQQQQQTQWY